jgi:hypothetical protein
VCAGDRAIAGKSVLRAAIYRDCSLPSDTLLVQNYVRHHLAERLAFLKFSAHGIIVEAVFLSSCNARGINRSTCSPRPGVLPQHCRVASCGTSPVSSIAACHKGCRTGGCRPPPSEYWRTLVMISGATQGAHCCTEPEVYRPAPHGVQRRRHTISSVVPMGLTTWSR